MINAFKTLTNGLIEYTKGLKGDWNENDSSSPNYIRNRTHYIDGYEIVFAKQGAEFVSMYNENGIEQYAAAGPSIEPYIHILTSTFKLEKGKEYIVVWDGVEYTCKCKDLNDLLGVNILDAAPESLLYLGNFYCIEGIEELNTHEPFFISSTTKPLIATLSTASTHDVEIKCEKIVKIPSKFLDIDMSNQDFISFSEYQNLNLDQQAIAKENLGMNSGFDGTYNTLSGKPVIYTDVVRYATQNLTTAQKTQARKNIGIDLANDMTFGADVIATGTDGNKVSVLDNAERIEELNTQISETVDKVSSMNFNAMIVKDGVTGYNYAIVVENGSIASHICLKHIVITTLPTKMNYSDTDVFDPTGMVLTATYEDGTTKEITSGFTYPTCVSIENGNIDIFYTEHGVTRKVTLSGLITRSLESALVDFVYTTNSDGTYTLTDWKGTYNGVASTECIIPNSSRIIL